MNGIHNVDSRQSGFGELRSALAACRPVLVLIILFGSILMFGNSRMHAEEDTAWEVIAGRNEFTDEVYFIITPKLPRAEFPYVSPKMLTSFSDFCDNIARVNHIDLEKITEPQRTKTYQKLFNDYVKGETDQFHLRQANEAKDFVTEVNADPSFFLRPFVAYENGVLHVGATTFGRIRVRTIENVNTLPKVEFVDLRSSLAPLNVQLRLDKNATIDLLAKDTPSSGLPGAGATDGVETGCYTSCTGEMAEQLISELLVREDLKLRRVPGSETKNLGERASRPKAFKLGKPFRDALDLVGLRQNPTTKHWELDPGKEKLRHALLAESPQCFPSEQGAYILKNGLWSRLEAVRYHMEFRKDYKIGNVSTTGEKIGELIFSGSEIDPVSAGSIQLFFKPSNLVEQIDPGLPEGYPRAEMAPCLRRTDGSWVLQLFSVGPVSAGCPTTRVEADLTQYRDGTVSFRSRGAVKPGRYLVMFYTESFDIRVCD